MVGQEWYFPGWLSDSSPENSDDQHGLPGIFFILKKGKNGVLFCDVQSLWNYTHVRLNRATEISPDSIIRMCDAVYTRKSAWHSS